MNTVPTLGSVQVAFLLATAITTVTVAAIAWALLKLGSSRSRGLGLSIAGSTAAILLGGIAFTVGITLLWDS